MFDSINVSDALPFSEEMKELGLDKHAYNFQTKDLDCALDLYFLQGNKLFVQLFENLEWIEGDPKAKSIADRFGYMKRENPKLVDVKITKIISFYDSVKSAQDKWDCWVEFRAEIVDGIVQRYELSDFRKTSNEARLIFEQEFQQNAEREKNLWHNKYFFFTKPWRKINHLWFRFFHNLGNFFHRIANCLP